MWKTKTFC